MREFETPDVQRFVFTRPSGLDYSPGQGVEVALDRDDWRDQGRPFTPTSHTDDGVLQFIIKAYPSHDGVTQRLHEMRVGESALVSEAFGTIQYRGPGVFLAGGAGITPFISIIRDLAARGDDSRQTLLFANKTSHDIICRNELEGFFGDQCHHVISEEKPVGYRHGRIDAAMLEEHVGDGNRYFYVCGPGGFVNAMQQALDTLGVASDQVVIEEA
jgi:cytochrome-b5 reductase